MKRSDFYQNINRNNTDILDQLTQEHDPNSISDIQIERIWLQEQDTHHGVQIIELNSSGNPQSPSDGEENTSAWSHVYPDIQDGLQANSTARERRRQAETKYEPNSTSNQTAYDRDFIFGYYDSGSQDIQGENVIFNHQMNCFTIVDNRFIINTDSSSDYENIEEIPDRDHWNGEEIVSFSNDPDAEKRTIWIYSFKNKHLLSEDFETDDVPSKDPSSTSCLADETEESLRTLDERAATPIPPSYIPRLILPASPPLPTLTEVTEPNVLSSSNQTDKSNGNDKIKMKPINNWCVEDNNDNKCSNCRYTAPRSSSYVVNWLSLSPRDKRRTLLAIKTDRDEDLPVTYKNLNGYTSEVQDPEIIWQKSSEARKAIAIQMCAAIEAQKNVEKSPNRLSQRSEKDSKRRDQSTETDFAHNLEDRGDFKKIDSYFRTPLIRFSPKPVSKFSDIKEPAHNLPHNNWMADETLDRNPRVYEVANVDTHRADTTATTEPADVLLITNMSLLKPTHWAEYLPIAGSIPSLHLSITSESEETTVRRPWVRKLANCFRCCK